MHSTVIQPACKSLLAGIFFSLPPKEIERGSIMFLLSFVCAILYLGDEMEKVLKRLASIEKKIDNLMKKRKVDRVDLLNAFAEALFIYHEHKLFQRGLHYAELLVEVLEGEGRITEDLILAWGNLSVFTEQTGDLKRTEELLEKIFMANGEDKGPQSKEAVEKRIFEANLRFASGNIQEAITILENNIDECSLYHKPDSDEMLTSYQMLSSLYCNITQYGMAADKLEHYLDDLKAIDERSPYLFECLRMISDVYELDEDYDSSLIYKEELLRLRREGNDRDGLRNAILELAITRAYAKKDVEASIEDLIYLQNDLIVNSVGDDWIEKVVSALSNCYIAIDDYEKASDCLYYLLVKAKNRNAKLDEISSISSRLSYAYALSGDHGKSIDVLREVYLLSFKEGGSSSDLSLSILDELGQAYLEAGRFLDSVEAYRSLVSELQKTGFDSLDDFLMASQSMLAKALMYSGEHYEAASIYQSLIKRQKKEYGLVDPFVAELMLDLSECYIRRNAKGDVKRAEKELLLALEILLTVEGASGELTIRARDMLDSL